MSVSHYIEQKGALHENFLSYIDSENADSKNEYLNLISIFQSQKISESRQELILILNLISQVTKNHHRSPYFFTKIEKILDYFESKIRTTFSNLDLIDIFKNNKRILLYLFEKKLITVNKFLLSDILHEKSKKDLKLRYYFYTEIKEHIDENTKNQIEKEMIKIDPDIFTNFEDKRKTGENDNYISLLIRNDSVEEFIQYKNKKNFSLTSELNLSIFETNSFLLSRQKVTLIEYAAFYGSIQIFTFLIQNGVNLTPSLWFCAIHGRNPDLIHYLEENNVELEDKTYKKYLEEAIKCHHNDIADYFFTNFTDQDKEREDINDNFGNNMLSFSYHYYNFNYLSNYPDNQYIFNYACKYNYVRIFELFLENNPDIDINKTVILTYFNVFIKEKFHTKIFQ